ncbi:hypothetical protein Btru_043351 [Bulinus truncatus]|nr:hypothetical protein Btru_043351 [Bulinus truncatus]
MFVFLNPSQLVVLIFLDKNVTGTLNGKDGCCMDTFLDVDFLFSKKVISTKSSSQQLLFDINPRSLKTKKNKQLIVSGREAPHNLDLLVLPPIDCEWQGGVKRINTRMYGPLMITAARSQREHSGRTGCRPGHATAGRAERGLPMAWWLNARPATDKHWYLYRRAKKARKLNITAAEVVDLALRSPSSYRGDDPINWIGENEPARQVARLAQENGRRSSNTYSRRKVVREIQQVFFHQAGNQRLLVRIRVYNNFPKRNAEVSKIVMKNESYKGDTSCKALEDERMRVATFPVYTDQPWNEDHSALLLAQVGFANNFCRVGKKKWKSSDDISAVHKELSRRCPMVTKRSCSNIPFETEISTERPRNIRYGPIRNRIESFQTWPNNSLVNPQDLAANGFYYKGVADTVHCFCCGGGVGQWGDHDDVRVEHAKHFPSCSFMLEIVGLMFVNAVSELKKTSNQITLVMVLLSLPRPEVMELLERLFSSKNVCHYHHDLSHNSGVRPCRSSLCIEGGPHDPVYPEYRHSDVRQMTLKVVTKHNIAIATAGFYYLKLSGHNVCYHCGVWQDFDTNDDSLDILAKHARSSPWCGHLRGMLGDRFMALLQEASDIFS